jgi:hypothetical protein
MDFTRRSSRAHGLAIAIGRGVVRDSQQRAGIMARGPGADGEPLRRCSIANPGAADQDVRYTPDSGAKADIAGHPRWANNRHMQRSK